MATGDSGTLQWREAEELSESGETVLLAVDRAPFVVESHGVRNTFCLLAPLMTQSGDALDREQFLNRDRVWWILRGGIEPESVRVGTIWSASIERSREFGNPDREKDHYQVRPSDVACGARRHVEILNLTVADPDLAELLDPNGIPWPSPPLDRVILRGGSSVVGPLRTEYDLARGRVRFTAMTPDDPVVYRVPRAVFESETSIRELSYIANRWDAKTNEVRVELSLVDEREVSILERKGKGEDGATDERVIGWALELLEIPARDRASFQAVFDRAGTLHTRARLDRFPGRLKRFLRLADERERVIELGGKVAETLTTSEVFKDLVDRHLDDATIKKVAQRLAEHGANIERQTLEAKRRLEDLERRIAEKEAECRRLEKS